MPSFEFVKGKKYREKSERRSPMQEKELSSIVIGEKVILPESFLETILKYFELKKKIFHLARQKKRILNAIKKQVAFEGECGKYEIVIKKFPEGKIDEEALRTRFPTIFESVYKEGTRTGIKITKKH